MEGTRGTSKLSSEKNMLVGKYSGVENKQK